MGQDVRFRPFQLRQSGCCAVFAEVFQRWEWCPLEAGLDGGPLWSVEGLYLHDRGLENDALELSVGNASDRKRGRS